MSLLLDEVLAKWAHHASIVLLHAVQMEAPRVTGTFAESMIPQVEVIGDRVIINIIATSGRPKAVWIRDGTAAHTIGEDGRFLWNPTGDDEFAAHGPVLHPGTERNEFGARALMMVRVQLLTSLAQEVRAAMIAAVAATRR